jgi:hypothetical protein
VTQANKLGYTHIEVIIKNDKGYSRWVDKTNI